MAQKFCKNYIAVILQTCVRGGNDPADLRQSLYSRGKFEICRCAVEHMMRTASRYKKSKPMRNRLKRYQNFAKDKRHLFTATGWRHDRERTPVTHRQRSETFMNFCAYRWSFALQDWLSRIFFMTTNTIFRFLSSVVGERRSRWSTSELILVFFRSLRPCEQSDVASMIHAVGRCRVLRKNPSKKQNYLMSFLSLSPSVRSLRSSSTAGPSHDAGARVVRSTSALILGVLRPSHASRLPSSRSLRPPRSCFDPKFSPKIFDKVPLCSTRGSCFQRKSSLSRQNSRSFQGYSWFLQFSRPFQDLENGFRNSSTFQGFQGPYAPLDPTSRDAADQQFSLLSVLSLVAFWQKRSRD